ncbi:MAG TPA: two-component regulator propeller domain-containing protein [Bryobacteraceae bacterium]|nr:two-component regulator propeller domain-containing protein [Bryobacteraceae bacterium]
MNAGRFLAFSCACLLASSALALDPQKSLTQYSRTVWTQQLGLPQDTIRAIAQTPDGFLWLGTDEGLARYDGYDFAVYNNVNSDIPANSVTTLAATPDDSLWIGTVKGLGRFKDGRFRTYTSKDGLPETEIVRLSVDRTGTLWVVAGVSLFRLDHDGFAAVAPGRQMPVEPVRAVCEDRHGNLVIAGYEGVVRYSGGKLTPVLPAHYLDGNIITAILADRRDNIWVGGSLGLLEIAPSGAIKRFGASDGLPDPFVRALCEDRDGNVWLGGNGGLERLEGNRFVGASGSGSAPEIVYSLFEDREGDLWVGADSGLSRLRDDLFTVYGKTEGLPSDEPDVVFQDHAGRVWVGFHDSGLMEFSPERRVFTARDGLPATEVFSIRGTRSGDLLVSTRLGLARYSHGAFQIHPAEDKLGRRSVFDAIEDSSGRVWLASTNGLSQLRDGREWSVVPGGPLIANAVVTILEDNDGGIWAGTYGTGLWRVRGSDLRLFTTSDGLASDQIRALFRDADGTVWIGTFGGGLSAYRDGRFYSFSARDGLLSDNIASVKGDGRYLWLSTTRGLCRVLKSQLWDFAAHRIAALTPENYGVEDGLRSAQCGAYPNAHGGTQTSDGRLWFTTIRGLAILDPAARRRALPAPLVHLVSMSADGQAVDLFSPARLEPGAGHLQIRFDAVHLSAPERVQYSYRLEGLDKDWWRAGNRHTAGYNLGHGKYRFVVRAEAPDAPPAETTYSFELLPHFYETLWFRMACAMPLLGAAWAAYRLRLRRIGDRFALVLEERARLAREIHDTLAQGFVGISSQLDAVAMCMPAEDSPARQFLTIAQKMARHSLTEARRSVMDLRASILDEHDLGAALQTGAAMWTAGTAVRVEVSVSGHPGLLPQEMEQHLLRIAQEAVANTLKHGAATQIWIKLTTEGRKISLSIVDNGRGFEPKDVFSSLGHFGLLGVRERAERLGGEMRLSSHPGEGTKVEVTAPLP